MPDAGFEADLGWFEGVVVGEDEEELKLATLGSYSLVWTDGGGVGRGKEEDEQRMESLLGHRG